MLPPVSFDSGTAGGVSGQTGAALAAGGIQVQVITDVRLSVTFFLLKDKKRKEKLIKNILSVIFSLNKP